jgi:hypothetical protein
MKCSSLVNLKVTNKTKYLACGELFSNFLPDFVQTWYITNTKFVHEEAYGVCVYNTHMIIGKM